MDIKVVNRQLEKYGKDVIEKYIENELFFMQDLKEQGKSLNNYINYIKIILCYIKNPKVYQIKNELGI